jgi:hypothetical protein
VQIVVAADPQLDRDPEQDHAGQRPPPSGRARRAWQRGRFPRGATLSIHTPR